MFPKSIRDVVLTSKSSNERYQLPDSESEPEKFREKATAALDLLAKFYQTMHWYHSGKEGLAEKVTAVQCEFALHSISYVQRCISDSSPRENLDSLDIDTSRVAFALANIPHFKLGEMFGDSLFTRLSEELGPKYL